jgi:DNA-directed RNA polymerase subunit RPC12/RpoP
MDTTLWIVIGAVVLLLAVGGFLLVRARSNRPKGDEYLHYTCPKCKKRLRYRLRQAGNSGACPRCDFRFIFPKDGE